MLPNQDYGKEAESLRSYMCKIPYNERLKHPGGDWNNGGVRQKSKKTKKMNR